MARELKLPDESLYGDYDDDRPRPLTGEEREDILSVLEDEKIMTIHPEITEIVLQQQINSIRMQMENFELCPSMIPNFKGWLINRHVRAMGDPKEPVGLNTAESISAPLTQINLNSFHSSGFAKNMSIEGYKEIYNASVHRKTPISDIHFKQKDLTVEEVLDYRTKIVGITIGDLILDKPQILKVKDISEEDKWWMEMYDTISGKTFDKIEYYLRIKFNSNSLFAYNVTLYDIASLIEKQTQSDGENICYIRPSPLNKSEIHIYAAKDKVMNVINTKFNSKEGRISHYIENLIILFYDNIIMPDIKNLILKGIQNISAIVPIFINTLDAIVYQEPLANEHNYSDLMSPFSEKMKEKIINYGDPDEEQLEKNIYFLNNAEKEMQIVRDNSTYEDLRNNVWKLWVNERFLRTSGVDIEKLDSLLGECGIKFEQYDNLEELEFDPYYYNLIKMPANWKYMLEFNPGKRDYVIVRMPNNWKGEMNEYYELEIIKQAQKSGKGWRNRLRDIKDKYKKTFDPLSYIRMKLQQDKEETAKKIENAKKEADKDTKKFPIKIKSTVDFKSKLNKASTYVYAQSIGSNLKHLLAHHLIDPNLTISNSYYEVLDCLGIEVTRNYIATELYEMIVGGGSNISCRHIHLIADVMTSSGVIVPITSKGATKQRRGVMTDITFQDAIKTIVQGAIVAKDENNRSASTQIFQGKRIELGTGGMNFSIRPDILSLLIDVEIQAAEANNEPIRMINGIPTPGIKGQSYNDLANNMDINDAFEGGYKSYNFEADNADLENLKKDGYGESIYRGYNITPKQPLPTLKITPHNIPWLDKIFKNLLFENLSLPSLKNLTKDSYLNYTPKQTTTTLQFFNPQILINSLP